jgi:glycerate 2-kinase
MSRLSGLRQMAMDIFRDGLLAADPVEAVHRQFKVKGGLLQIGDVDYFLKQFHRIWVVGAGKASAKMARAIEESLDEKVSGGLVIVKYGCGEKLRRITLREAGHPLPDEKGLAATAELLEFLKKIGKDDLVINLISGGGSSLLAAPAEGISLADSQATTELMLRAGMKIDEVNAVRKHLSRITGGRMARAVYPATIISLILSDVVGDRLDVIASGPTVPDTSTFKDAVDLLGRFRILEQAPVSVRKHLESGASGKIEETPKPGDPAFERAQNLVIGSNLISLMAAKQRSHKLELNTVLLTSTVQGEARELAKIYAAVFREILKSGNPAPAPACVVMGGEPTVTVRGKGKGGRSQELALAIAMEIQDLEGAFFLAAGTDGTDGPTDAAGAFADWTTVSRAKNVGMDPADFLARNDSYNFFATLGDLIKTGPTGTNVMDVHLLIAG